MKFNFTTSSDKVETEAFDTTTDTQLLFFFTNPVTSLGFGYKLKRTHTEYGFMDYINPATGQQENEQCYLGSIKGFRFKFYGWDKLPWVRGTTQFRTPVKWFTN